MKIQHLNSFPPNENPFHHDAFHMGVPVGKNVMIMYAEHEINKYIIVINIKTGKRIRITFDE